MRNKPTNEHYTVFAEICVANLPESRKQARISLVCLLQSLPKNHPKRDDVSKLLHHIEQFDRAQLEFCLNKEDAR